MIKKLALLIVCIAAVCLMANTLYADEPQQSTTGPTPPNDVIVNDAIKGFIMAAPPTSPVVIPNVPNYLWRHGCGPTAVGHVVGYYDGQGYNDLIPGDASTQTNAVDQAMASGGDSINPNPPGSEQHYEDYSRPEDDPVDGQGNDTGPLTDDYITQGRIPPHTDDCIGDYQRTSQSNHPSGHNYYGWSWSNDLGPSFVSYVNQRNGSYSPTYKEYSPVTGMALTWAILKHEINNNHPMVFLVDLNGDGTTDHFVVVVGYDEPTHQYGCHDSWDNTQIRWETFQGISSGQPWSIWGGWAFRLQKTKWEQPPDTSSNGMDIRFDRKDGVSRVLADDFPCTMTGPITKVKLWGSWKTDQKGTIQKIHLSIHSDDPVGAGGPDPYNTYSKPAELLWSKDVYMTDINETLFMDLTPYYEWWWDPNSTPIPAGDHKIWQYDITIDPCDAFVQDGNETNPKVYWLDAYAVLETGSIGQFGWKTSEMHWNDDAVRSKNDGATWYELRYPSQHPLYYQSIDLAFAIITGAEEPPEPNEFIVKYIQLPDLTNNGIDIRIDDSDGVTRHIADDFPCDTPGYITDIHFWGSWKYDEKCPITAVVVSFYSDDPIGPDGNDPCNLYSKPDKLLWQRNFYTNQIQETLYKDLNPEWEWWWDPYFHDLTPYGDQQVWQYDLYMDPTIAFYQEGNETNPKIYWMALEVWLPYQGGYVFGWKTSEEHWNDDAVFATGSIPPYRWDELRYPMGHPYYELPEDMNSIDMAFALTTCTEEPEPEPKWLQKPDLSENGLDVFDSDPLILADDFECTSMGPITDITVWGSWKYDYLPPGGANDVTFTLSFHSDIPDPDPNDILNWSMPGNVLWVRDVKADEVTIEKDGIEEGWFDPQFSYTYIFPGDTICWKYTFHFEPNEAFYQEGEPNYPVVYWLDVQAHPNDITGQAQFGWKSSIEHWNDDATWANGMEPYMGWWNELRYPELHPLQGLSIDLAFALDSNIPQQREDFGDAPDGVAAPGYPTLLANNGARHTIDGVTYLGILVDSEGDGQPTANADGDDLNPLLADDEDGVVIPVLKQGQLMIYTVTASVAGMLDAWVDYGADGSWAEAGDQIAAAFPLVGGLNMFILPVPATAATGQTYARFRFSTAGGLSPSGPAPDGEVEDYSVTIVDPNVKYLQRPDLSEYGIDIHFDRNDGIARTLADDFLCTSTGKITDVHLWCSWHNDIKGNVQKIHLSIHDDISAPNSPTGYSMPGTLLWERDFTPAQFTETLFYTLPAPKHEWWWDPYMYIVNTLGDTQIWRYDVNIPYTQAFRQTGDPNHPKVYWLDAWVMLDSNSPPEAQIGWKTSIDHWNDAAVYEDPTGLGWINLLYPIGHPQEGTNIDMAFAITTKPDCLKNTAPEYAHWVIFGRPDCWCYQRHCHADYNGTGVGVPPTKKWVTGTDLIGFKAAYNKSNLLLPPGGICADFNHAGVPAAYGPAQKRVTGTDLTIFKNYYNKPENDPIFPNTVCPGANYNFWTN